MAAGIRVNDDCSEDSLIDYEQLDLEDEERIKNAADNKKGQLGFDHFLLKPEILRALHDCDENPSDGEDIS